MARVIDSNEAMSWEQMHDRALRSEVDGVDRVSHSSIDRDGLEAIGVRKAERMEVAGYP